MVAKLPDVVGKRGWKKDRSRFLNSICHIGKIDKTLFIEIVLPYKSNSNGQTSNMLKVLSCSRPTVDLVETAKVSMESSFIMICTLRVFIYVKVSPINQVAVKK